MSPLQKTLREERRKDKEKLDEKFPVGDVDEEGIDSPLPKEVTDENSTPDEL